MPRGSVCAEIGVWQGDFSQSVLEVVNPQRLYLIDPWTYQPDHVGAWYGGKLAKSQADMDEVYTSVVTRFDKSEAISIKRMTSVEAAATFPDGYFDWIYIDGDHFKESVAADLRAWAPKIKPKGYICGDDYSEVGWWGDGVRLAVDEFVSQGQARMLWKNDKFILRPKQNASPGN